LFISFEKGVFSLLLLNRVGSNLFINHVMVCHFFTLLLFARKQDIENIVKIIISSVIKVVSSRRATIETLTCKREKYVRRSESVINEMRRGQRAFWRCRLRRPGAECTSVMAAILQLGAVISFPARIIIIFIALCCCCCLLGWLAEEPLRTFYICTKMK